MPDTSQYPSPGHPYAFNPARLLTEVKAFFSKCTHIVRSCIRKEYKLSKPSRSPWRIFVTGFTDTSKTCRFLSHCHIWGISLGLICEISSCSSNAGHSSTVSGRLLTTYVTGWVTLRKLHYVTCSYCMPVVLYCVTCSYCMPVVLHCATCSYCVSIVLYCITCDFCVPTGLLITLSASK